MAESTLIETTLVIRSYEDLRTRLTDLSQWTSTPLTWFSSRWLQEGEQRLDGKYYASDVMSALRLVKESGFTVANLASVTADIFYLDRFKRIYASTEKDGKPFLTPSEMLHFRPESKNYLAYTSGKVEESLVKPGWLLVTRSGSVGRCVIAGKHLSKFALSDDVIRILQSDVPIGYLYAFLSTWMGQALIVKDQYGSTIKHLESHHIATVPVPLLDEHEQQSIHAQIMYAYALRDEANDLLDEADALLHQALGLPRFDENLVSYLPATPRKNTGLPDMPHPQAFTINATELNERLDASYHAPLAQMAIALLHKGKYTPIQLSEMIDRVFLPPRFKRIYVDKSYGVPFLQGSHLPQIQPHDLKYISKKANEQQVKQCLVLPEWLLLTRSGTIGRVAVVSSIQKEWAASEHMIRIVPAADKGHSGYIAAFLMTPYGQNQITSKIHGAVVNEITTEDTQSVWIPQAPLDVQHAIGEKVILAYEKKDDATRLEESVIRELEQKLISESANNLQRLQP